MQHKFIDTVERLPGRDLLAFMSNHHIGPDMEIELSPAPTQARPDRGGDRRLLAPAGVGEND